MFSVVFILLVLVYYSEADIQLSGSVMIVRRVKSLQCRSDVNLSRYPGKMVAYHQRNQVYPAGTDRFVTNLRVTEALNTQYIVELQKFDNNTNIYNLFSVFNASNYQHVFNLTIHCSGLQSQWISLVDDDFYRYEIDHLVVYVYSESVKFSCLQYLHLSVDVQIGWINTAGNRIFTYNQTEITMKPAEVHNGSMLCCLYYTTSTYKNGKHIQRFVKDKTLLIYQAEMANNGSQLSGTTTESYCESNNNRNITETSTTIQFITDTSNATGKNSNTTNETGKITGTTNGTVINSDTTNETGKKPKTANKTRQNTGTTNQTGKNTGIAHKTSINSGSANETGNNRGTKNEAGKDSGTTNETGKTSNITNATDKKEGTTNETGKPSNITNATDKKEGTTNRTDSSDYDADTADYPIIIISSVSAIMLLLLLGICAIRKRCWKKTNRLERPRLPLPQIPGARLRPANEPDPNTPFYLNLLFRRECEQEIQAQEEPQYEEIIYH